jgi:hypothetical protein
MVRLLRRAGTKMLHIGANDFSTVPALPSSSAHFHGYFNAFMYVARRADAGTLRESIKIYAT